MDYFNLSRLIRNILYNFMRMFKYLSISLIAVCFIVLCLLLMSSRSSANAFDNTTADIPQTVINRFETEQNNYSLDDYFYFMYKEKQGMSNYYYTIIRMLKSDINFYITSSNNVTYINASSYNSNMYYINFYIDGTFYKEGSWYFNNTLNCADIETNFYSNALIYTDNTYTELFYSPQYRF